MGRDVAGNHHSPGNAGRRSTNRHIRRSAVEPAPHLRLFTVG
jgi:hypothetical protein